MMFHALLAMILGQRQRYTTVEHDMLIVRDSYARWGHVQREIVMWSPEFFQWADQQGRFHVQLPRDSHMVTDPINMRVLLQRERRGQRYYWYAYAGLPRRFTGTQSHVRRYIGRLDRIQPGDFWDAIRDMGQEYRSIMQGRESELRRWRRYKWRASKARQRSRKARKLTMYRLPDGTEVYTS